jgi:hypothetical protein
MRTTQKGRTLLHDHITIREVAGLLRASYFTAYSLAASGVLGEPLIVGRTHFFRRDIAEMAVRDHLARHPRYQPRINSDKAE